MSLEPFERLEAMMARQCARTPDAVAIEHGTRAVTYRELDRMARGVARQVAGRGIGPGKVVAIHAGRAPETIAAMLGVLRAGAAYVPVDPAQPVDRSALILASAQPDLVLADGPLPASLGVNAEVADLGEGAADADLPGEGDVPQRDPGNLAYVLYTSGSSGQPKGVALAHQASRYVRWAQAMFADGELARVAATTSIAFDPSVFEIYAPLATGGTIILKESLLEPFGEDERPTLVQGVPSALLELARMGALPASLRVLNIGGESLSPALCATIFEQVPGCRIFNHYGPTEATICTSVFEVPRSGGAAPTLGHPICGARVLILDDAGAQVPHGKAGEIAIAGDTLALGYHRRPDLTAERFVTRADGERIYLTGDIGSRLADGSLQFHGRQGDQVKINGVRIELAEVEAALLSLPGVSRVGSAVHQDDTGRARLVAYLPGEFGGSLADLRVALRDRLPLAMLPSALVRLDRFPLTATGKLDRKALPRPDFATPADAPAPASPAPGKEDPAAAVAGVFGELLGLAQFGVDDDFFAAGGDSLLAVQAALQLETVLDRVVPAGLIAQVPTPRGIAGLLALQQPVEGYAHIVPLSEGAGDATVFWAPDVHGQAISMMAIARAMEGTSFGLVPDAATLHGPAPVDYWALVRSYAAEIDRFRPEGTCTVAGYSFGGPWAFGVAACLEARGRQVVLCLVDPMNNLKGGLSVKRAYRFARITMGKVLGQRSLSVWRRLAGAAARRLADPAGLDRGVPAFVPPGARQIAARLIAAVPAFREGSFGGPAIVALSNRRPAAELAMDDDRLFGWRPLLPGPTMARRFDATHRELAMQGAGETARFLDAALADPPREARAGERARRRFGRH